MIRMILADDEPVITRGIQKLVDWSSLGIEIAGVYTDGKEVLDGIIRLQPELALLDISMPGMTGVEILKECHMLEIETKVIFISGFQDFEYARAALQYGAVDYLLKPVIRDELLEAVEKCLSHLTENAAGLVTGKTEEDKPADYGQLVSVEENTYLPILVEILYKPEEDQQIRKLVKFSTLSFLEEYVTEQGIGITFTKQDNIVIVLKGVDQKEGRKIVDRVRQEAMDNVGHSLGMVIGQQVNQMSEIPGVFQQCLERREYFYFADQMQEPVLLVDETVFVPLADMGRIPEIRSQMIDAIVAQEPELFQKYFNQYAKLLCRAADGKKEDACYYFCTAVRALEERFQNLNLSKQNTDTRELLEKGRSCVNYVQLQSVHRTIMESYLNELQKTMVGNDKRDFLKAKAYIENHYNENITLGVLAEEIHMNLFYFSSFFKKNAGENFKDYVNKIRIQHAVSLLISTDMKVYEIASQVGFSDARVFSENFQKIYHETPNAYRKRARENK